MSTLMTRGAVLTVSRLSNFAIVMISPLILVRLLDVGDYGRYQEFMLYATLCMALSDLHLDSSLSYFIPKNPERERAIVSHTSALVLGLSVSCVAGLLLGKALFVKLTSYDFVLPLAAYAFCFVNLNWLEYYWIAKRRTDLVLIYTAVRLVLRIGVLLVVAYVTRDVMMMLWAIVCAEAVRLLLVATYLWRRRLFSSDWTLEDVKAQLRFAFPIGASALVQLTGRNIGKLFVAGSLGPVALAHYAVGSYLIPLVRLIRGSIADVVFPEMVRLRRDPDAATKLWQRTNVLYCILLFPAFTLLVFHGELVIRTLFTAEYLPALPVFQIYMLFLLRRCFNLDVLLRSAGRTGYVLVGSVLALFANTFLLLVFHRPFGFIGPALAFIASEILLESYYATRVRRELQKPWAVLVNWKEVGSVAAGCIAGLPFLAAMQFAPGPELLSATVGSAGFVAICWLVAYRLGARDIGTLVNFGVATVCRTTRS